MFVRAGVDGGEGTIACRQDVTSAIYPCEHGSSQGCSRASVGAPHPMSLSRLVALRSGEYLG